eukprot:10440731-Alexandrium_andersonii.AAC.1
MPTQRWPGGSHLCRLGALIVVAVLRGAQMLAGCIRSTFCASVCLCGPVSVGRCLSLVVSVC